MRIAIIPARAGSRRVPRKNIRPFHGRPVIAYSIEAALASGVFHAVYVSTDDNEIADVAKNHGAGVLMRHPDMADDQIGTQEVMRYELLRFHRKADTACCIYATAPMLRAETLKRAYYALDEFDYVVPVATWLRDPGQFYMGQAEAFVHGRPLIGERTRLLQIDPATECDINTEDDWLRAERMYADLHKENV